MVFIEDTTNIQDIKLTSTIQVTVIKDSEANVSVPAELRLTEGLLKLINDALSAQGLELRHMNIAEVHRTDLEGLPNVVLDEQETKG